MRISSSQLEAISFAVEELREISALLERIVAGNQNASGEELRSLGITWELVLAAGKELKSIRKRKEFYEYTADRGADS